MMMKMKEKIGAKKVLWKKRKRKFWLEKIKKEEEQREIIKEDNVEIIMMIVRGRWRWKEGKKLLKLKK